MLLRPVSSALLVLVAVVLAAGLASERVGACAGSGWGGSSSGLGPLRWVVVPEMLVAGAATEFVFARGASGCRCRCGRCRCLGAARSGAFLGLTAAFRFVAAERADNYSEQEDQDDFQGCEAPSGCLGA